MHKDCSLDLMIQFVLKFRPCAGCHENYLAVKFTDPHIIKVGMATSLHESGFHEFCLRSNHSPPDGCMSGGLMRSRLYAKQNTKTSTVFTHAIHPFCCSPNPCSLCHISSTYNRISSFNDTGALYVSSWNQLRCMA